MHIVSERGGGLPVAHFLPDCARKGLDKLKPSNYNS